MNRRAFRPIALFVGLLLLMIAAAPAQAGPIQIGEVLQVVTGSQHNNGQQANVQLRYLAEGDKATAGSTNTPSGTVASPDGTSASGVDTALQDPGNGATVQTEVTEDIGVEQCDCGEFRVPVAGFPKWPFIPAIGLICLVPDLCTTNNKCTPGPGQDANCKTCEETGTCPEVPEPASLLLFGSGLAALGAGFRRRRAAAANAKLNQETTISGS